jgi:hypothetical protein
MSVLIDDNQVPKIPDLSLAVNIRLYISISVTNIKHISFNLAPPFHY